MHIVHFESLPIPIGFQMFGHGAEHIARSLFLLRLSIGRRV